MKINREVLVLLLCFLVNFSEAQDRVSRLERLAGRRSDFVPEMFARWNHTVGVKIDSIRVSKDSLLIDIYFNPSTSHIPVRSDLVTELRNRLKQNLGRRFRKYAINLRLRGRSIDEFIPNAFRDSTLKADEKRYSKRYEGAPVVTRPGQDFEKGLRGNHIALWPSHGYFFDQQLDRWQWQRARLWQTVEDIFPLSFTSSYLTPMLENAGANVLLPRERDTQVNEVIVDNDLINPWGRIMFNNNECHTSQYGFRWSDTLFPGQNPFLEGTSLSAKIDDTDSVEILYIPDIPETGHYAVYISYQKTQECISSVPYWVNHSGGGEKFLINQCIGYGTWVYLGTFHFLKGMHTDSGSVSVNVTGIKGILSSDAVRFGGGMGNVARRPGTLLVPRQRSADDGGGTSSSLPVDSIQYTWKISGKPRWMEGSRYYLQYAGMPDTITYSLNLGGNDYNDDYMSRPEWVNYLIGPSKPQYTDKYSGGLNIQVDLSLAFHTDAGITENDSVIGTLGIYSTVRNDGIFPDGRSKMASRDLTDIVQTQIVDDIRALMNPKWTRRGLWDREYSEAWRPVVPSMLLELLSHQNLADMKFGLDPRFKFIASRSVYKGILRYLASEQQREIVVQPLPPDHMAIERLEKKKIRLSWKPVSDPIEATAVSEGYKVYMRTGDNGFAPPMQTAENYIEIELPEWNTIYSFRVTSVNSGGESMPGETLSVCLSPEKDPFLIVNAFDRVCAPTFFDTGDLAGIAWWIDEGVPYIKDESFSGYQYNFKRDSEWLHDDSQGWGASNADMETIRVEGNTFDFPLIHGKAILSTGNSFVSVSDEVFESPDFNADIYKITDIIFGEERGTESLSYDKEKEFRIFTAGMINKLVRYTNSGGNLFISGAYIGTDMVENNDSSAIQFAADVLHYIWRTNHATTKGDVISTDQGRWVFPSAIAFNTDFGTGIYRVEAPDAIEPVGKDAFRICRYESGSTSAGVAFSGDYKIVTLGFPFETIISEADRNSVMERVIEFLNSRK